MVLALFFVPAYGASVTVVVEGVFFQYTDPDGLLPFAGPAPGTIFRIEATYDSDTPDSIGSISSTVGIYQSAVSDISLTIGGNIVGTIGARNSILILDDNENSNGTFTDFWLLSTRTDIPAGTENQTISEGFSFYLYSGSTSLPVGPLTSDNLAAPPSINAWDEGFISYSISRRTTVAGNTTSESLASAYATITSVTVVPVPAALWLFLSGLVCLPALRRITSET